ncbi:MAG: hypothetical protein AAGG44_05215, partial [Planctomycetota bacterium]
LDCNLFLEKKLEQCDVAVELYPHCTWMCNRVPSLFPPLGDVRQGCHIAYYGNCNDHYLS